MKLPIMFLSNEFLFEMGLVVRESTSPLQTFFQFTDNDAGDSSGKGSLKIFLAPSRLCV